MSSNQENKTMDTPNYIQRVYVKRNKRPWLKRLTVYVTSFVLLYQPLVPAISAALTDAYIQDRLNSFANFEVSNSSQYQFCAAILLQFFSNSFAIALQFCCSSSVSQF